MSVVDLIVVLLAAFAAYRGWRRGFVRQVFEYGGGFAGLLLGIWLGPIVASAVTDGGIGGALVSLVIVFIGLSLGQAIGFVLGHHVGTAAANAKLGQADSFLGAAFGIAITLVSFWLVGSLLLSGPSKPVAKALKHSNILKLVSDALPRPPNLFAYIQHYLNTSNFPQVFAGFPRSVGPPVKLPSGEVAQKAARAAQASTVRVVMPACGGLQLGSGWVSAPSTVVTNAHVVAGGSDVTVQDSAGRHPGQVVLFDPRTDIAVIHAVGLAGPPLRLDDTDEDPGTPGATLGYPGNANGTLVIHRAAVQDTFDASGYDIYGRADVTRHIYEIRSIVRQGDSGGPFVLPSGEVAGVVFAASTTDDDTGYVLTGREVADEVAAGASRTEAVSTRGCTR
ncbi:MAG TPA: MarP family serine protease [Actinomycetota bacterium]|nr:MarP family serine protease [Actinomycetota bacterium]